MLKHKKPARNVTPQHSISVVFIAVIVILSIAGSFETATRNAAWKNEYLLYSTDVLNAPNSARLHYWYGNQLIGSNVDGAISEFDKAIQIYPEYSDAFGERGLAYANKGDKVHAEADYKKAIGLKSQKWIVFNNLGVLYGGQNRFDEAMNYFQLALQLDDRRPDPYKNIANIYFSLGDYSSAAKWDFETLRRVTSTDAELEKQVYAQLSLCYAKAGDTANQRKYANLARGSAR
jgi:Flp pilus assembly protein TadD